MTLKEKTVDLLNFIEKHKYKFPDFDAVDFYLLKKHQDKKFDKWYLDHKGNIVKNFDESELNIK